MKLDTIMKRFPQTIESADTLMHARDFMIWGDFHHLPVLDRGSGRLVGILSEGDIVRHQRRTGATVWSRPGDSVKMAMTRNVHTASPRDTLAEAATRMKLQCIGCLPVTEKDQLVGLVTTVDVLAARIPPNGEQRSEPRVASVMTATPKAVHPNDNLLDAAARLMQYHLRHLPVVDGENRLIAMLSERDVQACIGDPALAFAEEAGQPESLLRVRHAMKKPLAMVTPEQSCTTAARTMADTYASVVPVVNGSGLLVGVVTYLDLLRG